MNMCLIVTGGTVSKEVFEAVLLEYKFDKIIACDKGIEACDKMGILPDVVIGDFDSADKGIVDKYRDKTYFINLKVHKDMTDTHVAVNYAIEQAFDEVIILGATGTRADHMLANIGLLKQFVENNIRAYIIDANNKITMTDKSCIINKSENYTYISLIPYTECVKNLSLMGFFYECDNINLTIGDSLGISNELTESKGRIEFSQGLLIIIESHD